MDLETLVVAFGADLSGLTRGVAGVKTLLAGVGLAAVGAAAMSVKMAGDFQESMTQLVTGAGESQKNIGMVSAGILNMAVATGTSTKQLADGMYMIESAGYHGAAGLKVLQASAEAAKVGNADLGTVANGVTTIMTDYASKNVSAAQAANILVTTVANGKTHMQDLADSLAMILPTASAAGVGLYDVSGAMATMTGEGVPAADAATYLRQLIMALDAPSKASAKALAAIGLTTGQVAAEMKVSLPDTLKMIQQHLAEVYGVGTPQYIEALKNIAGGSKQMQGILDLTGDHLGTFGHNVQLISQQVKQGGNSITGWSLVQQDFNFKMSQAGAVVETLMIKIGTALLPVITKLLGQIMPIVSGFGQWLTSGGHLQTMTNDLSAAIGGAITVIGDIIGFTQQYSGVILGVAGVLTAFFIPALIKSGVEAVAAGIKTSTQFVASIVKAGLAGWEAAGKLGLFIAQLIATGAKAVATGAVMAAQFVAKLVVAGAQAAATAAIFVAKMIPSLISMAAQAIIAAATAIPPLIAGFISWAITAGAAAVAQLALIWPILLVVAAVAALVAIVVLVVTHWQQVSTFFKNLWNDIVNIFKNNWQTILEILLGPIGLIIHFWSPISSFFKGLIKDIGNAFSGLGTLVHSVWDGIAGAVKSAINFVIGLIDGFIGGIDSIGIDVGPVHVHPNIPKIPYLATGGTLAPGQVGVVGERGPEIAVGGPGGTSILGTSQSAAMLAGGKQPEIHVHIYLNGREMSNQLMMQVLSEIRGGGHPLGAVA